MNMTKFMKASRTALLLGLGTVLIYGCDSKETGPVEKAGQEVDKAVVSVGKSVEKAGEKIQDAGQPDK